MALGAKLPGSNLQPCLLLSTAELRALQVEPQGESANLGPATAADDAGGGTRVPELAWDVAETGQEQARRKAFF